MWYRLQGISGNKSLEEILEDKDLLHMLDYNKGNPDMKLHFIKNPDPLNIEGPLFNCGKIE